MMNQSNTKLDKVDRDDRKQMLFEIERLGGALFSFPDCGAFGVTVLCVPQFENSRMMQVAVAVASPNEQKFRRKVGEYVALCHWFDGNTITVPVVDDMQYFAEGFADALFAYSKVV